MSSSMTRWWWIRHAPVSHMDGIIYGDSDPEANVTDLQKFTSVATRLPEQAIWIITNLKRTRQTADAIANAGYCLPEVLLEEHRLREQGFGEWHGVPHAEHNATRTDPFIGIWNCAPDDIPPGGESFIQVMERVRESVEAISEQYRGQDIVCVAHGGTIRAALALALRLKPADALAFTIDNVSISRINHRHSSDRIAPNWRVVSVNT